MISERLGRLLRTAAIPLAATACNGESIEEGLTVHLAEVHLEARPGAAHLTPTLIPNADNVTGGYDQDGLEKHPIRDVNGTVVALYRAYLVIDGLELAPCPSPPIAAALGTALLNALVPAAHAHAGHGAEPVGGRSLDQPNVIDIVTQEGFVLPLGDMAIAPGSYCGLRVALVRLAGEGYGKPEFAPASPEDPVTSPEVPDLAGRMFALRADYCAQTDAGRCVQRVRVDIDDDGLAEPSPVTLEFAQPLLIDATFREVYVALGVSYGEWMQNIDVTQLAGDPDQRQQLLDNIVGSLYVNGAGLGALPVNVVE